MYALTVLSVIGNYNRMMIIVFDEDGRLNYTLQAILGSINSVKRLNIKWKDEDVINFHKKLLDQNNELMYIEIDRQIYTYFVDIATGFKWDKPIVDPINLESPIIDKFGSKEISGIIDLSLSDKLHINLLRIVADYVKEYNNHIFSNIVWESIWIRHQWNVIGKIKYYGSRIIIDDSYRCR
jgi:hypothetical protein